MRAVSFFLVVLLVLSGCDMGGGDSPLVQSDYRRGYEGLSTKFIDSPKKVFAGDEFDLTLELENRGAADIDEGFAFISSVNDDFKISEPIQSFSLKGKTKYVDLGEKKLLKFGVKVLEDEAPTTFISYQCYPYSSELITDICLEPAQTSADQYKECPSYISVSGGQGGPISVDRIEMVPSMRKDLLTLVFNISLRNHQRGTILDYNAYPLMCQGAYEVSELERVKNNVDIEAELSGIRLSCSHNVLLNDLGTGSVICRGAPMVRPTTVTTAQLRVRLDYGHTTEPQLIKMGLYT